MVTIQQALSIAESFKVDVCDFVNIDKNTITIKTAQDILFQKEVPELLYVPQFTIIDPVTRIIYINESFLKSRSDTFSFTPLRSEIYLRVRMLYLFLNPKEQKGNIFEEALCYSSALMLLKGLQIPSLEIMIPDYFSKVSKILKDEFHLEANIVKVPQPDNQQPALYQSSLSTKEEQRYINKYHPLPTKSTVVKYVSGTKGTKDNPCDNVYDAVELIKKLEQQAHNNDSLLNDIEQQKYFYDVNQHHFRIHWASPYVSQYANNLPTRSFMVNQMETRYFSIKPNLYRHKFLYRGQSDSYEGKPCVPNLFRDKEHNDKKFYLDFLIFFSRDGIVNKQSSIGTTFR